MLVFLYVQSLWLQLNKRREMVRSPMCACLAVNNISSNVVQVNTSAEAIDFQKYARSVVDE